MKRFLLSMMIACALFGGKADAQYGLLIPVMIPSGSYYPYLLKPGFGAEFNFKLGEIDQRCKLGFTLGYFKFNPTQDTFKSYVIGGNPLELYPSAEIIHNYSILQMGPTFDFKVLPDGKFSPVLGLDFFINVISIDEDDINVVVTSSSTGDTYYNYALQARLGAQYQLNNNWLFSAGIERSMGFGGEIGQQAFWKPYISIMFYTN